jgi:Zn-dependent M28 family amino/carboxypeptidase
MSKGCAAVVLHNTMYAEKLGYIPIYKGIYFASNETDPTIPIFMTSKAMGDELKAGISTSKLRLHIVVTVQVKPVPVVEGILKGTGNPNEWVAVGAHLDTVYNGPGADDNTAGTVAVTGLARAMAKEHPKRAIRFLAYGAEELGLKGSAAYLGSQPDNVADFCKLLINLDMPNIDLERSDTGNIVSNDNWTVSNLDHARDMLNSMEKRYQRYDLTIAYTLHTGGSDNVVFEAAGIPVGYADGSGSLEYHTYKDDTSRTNIESIGLEARIVGSAVLAAANK